MNLVEYAKHEFEMLGWPDDDDMQKMMRDNILEVLEVLSKQRHSDFSIHYLMDHINRLVKFLPLTPLTEEDDNEWIDVGEGLYQNKRCSAVLKNEDGMFYIHGIVFVDSSGFTFTNRHSCINITFPFFPPNSPEYVYLDENWNVVRRENSWWQDKYLDLNKDKMRNNWNDEE